MSLASRKIRLNFCFQGVNGPLQQRGAIFDQNLEKEFFYSDDETEAGYIDYELLEMDIPYCNYSRLRRNQVCQEIIVDDQNITTTIYHKDYQQYLQKRLVSQLIDIIFNETDF